MIEQEFIPYEQALALKELGFDEPCLFWYNLSDNNKLATNAQFDSYNPVTYTNITIPKRSSYNKELKAITAPLFQQAFKWFRDKYLLHGCIDLGFCPRGDGKSGFKGYIKGIHERSFSSKNTFFKEIETKCFDTPEEAELECLKKLIEICSKLK